MQVNNQTFHYKSFAELVSIPERKPSNAKLLKKYQSEIDTLKRFYTEEQIYNLMSEVVTDEHGSQCLKMRYLPNDISLFPTKASLSTQINAFKDFDVLLAWVSVFSIEARNLSFKIYARSCNKKSCNTLPVKLLSTLESAAYKLVLSVKYECVYPLDYFIKFIEIIIQQARYSKPSNLYQIDNSFERLFCYTVQHHADTTLSYLRTPLFLSNLPVYAPIKPCQMSDLLFSFMCFNFLKNVMSDIAAIDCMLDKSYVNAKHLHPKAYSLITLVMTWFEVLSQINIDGQYGAKLTSPDLFIASILFKPGKRNMSGFEKNMMQSIRKVYLYIALLLNPDWSPCAKKISRLLRGEDRNIIGRLNFASKSKADGSVTNNISGMSSKNYLESLITPE